MQRSLILTSIVLFGVVSCSLVDQAGDTHKTKSSPKVTKSIPHRLVRIAVIDTGIADDLLKHKFLCKDGHKDFSNTGLTDRHGHGTHISGLVDQYAKDFIFKDDFNTLNNREIENIQIDYCQVIVKYYDPTITSNTLKATIESFKWAIKQKVDIINYSGGGTEFSQQEYNVVMEALNKGIKVVAAAGNERTELSYEGKGKYYPAMYDKRIYIVGNLVSMQSRKIASTSNYGDPVNTWEVGTNVYSRLPGNSFGTMTGTSQAAAIKSGRLIYQMLHTK